MSSEITNRTVKPFIKLVDLYPGFKLEEECFAKVIIKDVEKKSKFRRKSDLDFDEGPLSYPREKPGKQTAYERFLEDAVDSKTGEFYPQRESDGRTPIKNTGCNYYINAIYRVRRADSEKNFYSLREWLMPGVHWEIHSRLSITTPEIWTKTNFDYLTKWNDKSNQLEREFQGVIGQEDLYLMPFNKQNLKELYERRMNDLVQLAVKEEATRKVFEVKDVTGNISKSYELLRD